nr:tetratricopeptide repeat protein [uncultured Pseudomonas sp.]
MPRRTRYLIALLALMIISALFGYLWRDVEPEAPTLPAHSYVKALRQAHEGQPGAARVLYQQLQRRDLPAIRRAALYEELPNYPSVQAFKLAQADLTHADSIVRRAAVSAISRMLPAGQQSLVLGPLLDDSDQAVRFAAVGALLSVDPDSMGLYVRALHEAIEAQEQVLLAQPEDVDGQVQLARLYLHEDEYAKAGAALERALASAGGNVDAVALKVELLERQGAHDASRQVLADALAATPESAFLQHELGRWLIRHGQQEYALLALSRAVELDPDNAEYRLTLARTLHELEQLDAAQRQLDAVLSRSPANRQARILLIEYWKEAGQLQNVQVLLAELERQNPDDPFLQKDL